MQHVQLRYMSLWWGCLSVWVFKVYKVGYSHVSRDSIIYNNTIHPRLKYMVIIYLTKQNKNTLDTHKYNWCFCPLKGKRIKYRNETIRKKNIHTKPSALVSQKCILKSEGLKTHQSLPVFATFCLFLPVWCGFGSATMLTSEKYHYGLVSKKSAQKK